MSPSTTRSPGGTLTDWLKRLAVVTTARSDYGILRPLMVAVRDDPALTLLPVVGGAHLSERFGRTERDIATDGFDIAARVDFLPATDDPHAIARALGVATSGFADAIAGLEPDLVVLLGDRWETLAAASAAHALGVPVGHLHGGELTLGAMDDAFRHAITKLAHLHFVATDDYAARVRQLGEEDWRVVVSGAPALDGPRIRPPADRRTVAARLGRELPEDFLLVTYHPVTTELSELDAQLAELAAALEAVAMPCLFTYAGADAKGTAVNAFIEARCAANPAWTVLPSLGGDAYFGAMAAARAMVGNSSSGIIEAASFRLPVVNIGSRQAGRARGANVVDCGYPRAEIEAAIRRAIAPGFAASWGRDFRNPYDRGGAVAIIMDTLGRLPDRRRVLAKGFVDRPEASR